MTASKKPRPKWLTDEVIVDALTRRIDDIIADYEAQPENMRRMLPTGYIDAYAVARAIGRYHPEHVEELERDFTRPGFPWYDTVGKLIRPRLEALVKKGSVAKVGGRAGSRISGPGYKGRTVQHFYRGAVAYAPLIKVVEEYESAARVRESEQDAFAQEWDGIMARAAEQDIEIHGTRQRGSKMVTISVETLKNIVERLEVA